MSNKFIETNDATYRYTVQGEGEPLVLLHGFTGSIKTWDDCSKKWAKDFKVISLDLPGHGKTVTKSPRTMDSFCEDLQTLLEKLDIKKVHLLGYSMGGRAALSFAITYPESVATLILESASPGLKTEIERENRIEADARLTELILERGVEHFVSYWENIPLFETQKRLAPEIKGRIRQERLSQTSQGLADSLTFMGTGKQPSWWKMLHELNMPVCLIVGLED